MKKQITAQAMARVAEVQAARAILHAVMAQAAGQTLVAKAWEAARKGWETRAEKMRAQAQAEADKE